GDLGAVAGFAGDAADFHGAIGNFVHFRFEEAADEVRMTAGEDDLGAAAFVFHGHDVGADAVTDVVFLGLDALAGRHDALELAEVDEDIAAVEAPDGAGDDVSRAVLELLVNH